MISAPNVQIGRQAVVIRIWREGEPAAWAIADRRPRRAKSWPRCQERRCAPIVEPFYELVPGQVQGVTGGSSSLPVLKEFLDEVSGDVIVYGPVGAKDGVSAVSQEQRRQAKGLFGR